MGFAKLIVNHHVVVLTCEGRGALVAEQEWFFVWHFHSHPP